MLNKIYTEKQNFTLSKISPEIIPEMNETAKS